MQNKKFSFSNLKNKKILLLTHENADLDTFCSATIFNLILKKKGINSTIAIPSHMNEQTFNFAKKEKINFLTKPNLNNFNAFFLFDFNDFEQLGSLRSDFEYLIKNNEEFVFDIFAIDHHQIEKSMISKNGFINPDSFSTTQILFNNFKKDFDKKMFFYCAIGILEDTGRFLVASKELFNEFSICLEKSNKSYGQVFSYAKHEIPRGEKIAFLKAASRAKILKINSFVIINSKLNFYQGAAATKLLEFGADISIVCGKEKSGLTKMSLRAETGFKEKFKFNLMKDVLIILQKECGGDIGGHSGAAQWSGNMNESNLIKIVLKIIEKKLLSYKNC